MKPRIALAVAITLVAVAACGDDDAATTTTAAETTTTAAATTTAVATTIAETTTTVAPATTTTASAPLSLPLIDTFDGSTMAVPGSLVPDVMTMDLGDPGFLTLASASHSGSTAMTSYYVYYPVTFRDGIVTLRFRAGSTVGDVAFSLYLWASDEFYDYTEVAVDGDMVTVLGFTAGASPTQTVLPAVGGTFDPAGFNELRVEAFDGTLSVFLNDVALGEVIDPAPLHEGLIGFALYTNGVGSTMVIDEFSAVSVSS